jgi:hypothetical protein
MHFCIGPCTFSLGVAKGKKRFCPHLKGQKRAGARVPGLLAPGNLHALEAGQAASNETRIE